MILAQSAEAVIVGPAVEARSASQLQASTAFTPLSAEKPYDPNSKGLSLFFIHSRLRYDRARGLALAGTVESAAGARAPDGNCYSL